MNCPVCDRTALYSEEIEVGLNSNVCPECNGKWITFQNYERWVTDNSTEYSDMETKELDLTIPEFELARLCPECRRILVKYKVGSNIPFLIDRCTNCAGLWLDSDEWETLIRRNLHNDLHKIFTDHWQAEVARDETRKTLKGIYGSKFGKVDYKKITAFKEWADEHEKRDEIISYIRDKNPLQF